MPRLFADFNGIQKDAEGEKIPIGREGTRQVERYRPLGWLEPGATVQLQDGEMEVSAVLEFAQGDSWWYGRPDWSTRRDLRTSADGLEEYAELPPREKMILLRIETEPLAEAILGAIELLQSLQQRKGAETQERNERAISDLARMAEALSETLRILTR